MSYLIKKLFSYFLHFSYFSRRRKKINTDKLKTVLRGILTTREEEISCDECFTELDEFVDMEFKEQDAAKALPLVQDHLNRCQSCREEYEILLEVLKTQKI